MKTRPSIYWLYILSLMLISTAVHAQTAAFEQMLEELLSGSVPAIDTQALEKQLAESDALILLDAREPDEYAVSHLQNARNVGFENFDIQSLADIDKNSPIVVYCSVGYRSEKIGEELQEAGYTNVINLRGGIFDWANQKLPLVNEEQETVTTVHPYDEEWGRWLAGDASSELESKP